MHIPENYLSPATCAAMSAVMLPVWYLAVKKVKEEMPKDKLPLLGIGAAFSFLGMMFNVPLPGGTTGHAVGGTLLAVLFGPWAACLTVTVALFIQALFFGDGGLLAFGANCFNMAFALPFTGYFIYSQLKKHGIAEYASAAAGAYAGINTAAFCAAVEFGIQPLLFTDAAGQALYCPYPLTISIPAMMAGHLTLFGLAEVVFTVAILLIAYLVVMLWWGSVDRGDKAAVAGPAGGKRAPVGQPKGFDLGPGQIALGHGDGHGAGLGQAGRDVRGCG